MSTNIIAGVKDRDKAGLAGHDPVPLPASKQGLHTELRQSDQLERIESLLRRLVLAAQIILDQDIPDPGV